jgi:hemolysin-activating ACP:hemolysin acyltransferase|tara:strand:+ start:2887 stop:3303 length:417 start_codon:yes stop_codon:yes gene_type:complete
MDDVLDIMELYKVHYPLWNNHSIKEIYYHIYPSIALGQYRVHKDEDEIYGFRNWAFLNEDTEKRFLETRELGFYDWNSGDRAWCIDSIFLKKHKEAMNFYKTFFTHLLGIGKKVQWLRIDPNGLVRNHMQITTKEYML